MDSVPNGPQSGKISWFGGPNDPSAGGTPASGIPITTPGISLYNQSTLRGYWLVKMPNGKQAVLQQTDIGPAPWTGRMFDFTSSALPHLGYSEQNFPTNASITGTYLGKSIPAQYRGLAVASGGQATNGSLPGPSGATPTPVPTGSPFDQAGYQKAMAASLAGNYLKSAASNPYSKLGPKTGLSDGTSALFGPGLLTTAVPNRADYQQAQSALQKLAGGTVLTAHPQTAAGTLPASGQGGGFFPAGAKYVSGRQDQGRDSTTNPGGPIIAPGNGYVVRIGSDPGGFGPDYPIVHFTSGPYAGRTMYIGHTHAAITSGNFQAGATLSHTGTSGVGNATVPGWSEIGFADGGSPGRFGQPAPFA